jgi:LmbE family N-acetylglucosaminyl deacetylase
LPHTPDDETIGAGGQLSDWPDIRVTHATYGAPYNMDDAILCGLSARSEYAVARRAEVVEAHGLAGIAPAQVLTLDLVDQECGCHLLASLWADRILAPRSEGRHPDHDSPAFAVHTACRWLARDGEGPPENFEYALYYSREGHFCAGECLSVPNTETIRIRPGAYAETRKKRMIGCFRTQYHTLAPFPAATEIFRRARPHDFSEPPHVGKRCYEHFSWGVTGAQWRAFAWSSTAELELGGA